MNECPSFTNINCKISRDKFVNVGLHPVSGVLSAA